MSLSKELVAFAANGGNVDFYVAFQDYYFNRDKMTSEQRDKLDKAFMSEVENMSHYSREGIPENLWMNNMQVRYTAFSVVEGVINAILPRVLTDAFGLFTDLRFVGVGDIVKFRVMPRQLFTLSVGGKGERTVHRQKDFAEDIIVSPIEHIVTVYTDMYRVLAGKESITDFIPRVILRIEQAMYGDALKALNAAVAGLPVSDLNVSGAFDMKKLLKMAETVEVQNAGARPVIVGSAIALMKVLPDSTLGYRGTYSADGGAIDLIKNVYGYDVMRLKNAEGVDGKLVLSDNLIYVISPAQDKLIKGVVSDSMSNGNQFYDNADITSNFTTRKCWEFVVASAAAYGVYNVTDG